MTNVSNSYKFEINTLQGEEYEITENGSLGLLALGYKGVMAWRNKRKQILKNSIKINNEAGEEK